MPSLSIIPVALLSFGILAAIVLAGNPPKFLKWGDKCKRSSNLKPNEECDISKGLLCQRYEQGDYCGCQIDSSLTYDRHSQECRRRVMAVCFYDSESDITNSLTFAQKCHDWAECVKPNWTAITGRTKPDDTMVCQCREGYEAKKDFSECVQKRVTGTASSATFLSIAMTIPIVLVFLLCS